MTQQKRAGVDARQLQGWMRIFKGRFQIEKALSWNSCRNLTKSIFFFCVERNDHSDYSKQWRAEAVARNSESADDSALMYEGSRKVNTNGIHSTHV